MSDLGYEEPVYTNDSIVDRALPDTPVIDPEYVSNLVFIPIDKTESTTAMFFQFGTAHRTIAGVDGLFGCTSVIIASARGVYVAHIWENPVFWPDDSDVETDEATFQKLAFEGLRDGAEGTASISALIGTDSAPGPLHPQYVPKAFIITPYTTLTNREYHGVTTDLRYEDRINWLAQKFGELVMGEGNVATIFGYNNKDESRSDASKADWLGRVALEMDPLQYRMLASGASASNVFHVGHGSGSTILQVGRWRLWVEAQRVAFRDFVISPTPSYPFGDHSPLIVLPPNPNNPPRQKRGNGSYDSDPASSPPANSSSARSYCALGSCGDACSGGIGPSASASATAVAASETRASVSTMTTSILPSNTYQIYESVAADATLGSKRTLGNAMYEESDFAYGSMAKRAFADVTSPNPQYVSSLRNVNYISKHEAVTSTFFMFPSQGRLNFGVDGLFGCTAVIITSTRGVYIAHIWERPVFLKERPAFAGGDDEDDDDDDDEWDDEQWTTDQEFQTMAFNSLRDGRYGATTAITSLIGDQNRPGPLNSRYSPNVLVITPITTAEDRQEGITTALRYQARAEWLRDKLSDLVIARGQTRGHLVGYDNRDRAASENRGSLGRCIVEMDALQYRIRDRSAPNAPILDVGRSRVWVESRMIAVQDFVIMTGVSLPVPPAPPAPARPALRHRDDGTTSQPASSQSTSSYGRINPSSCTYAVRSEPAITIGEYTLQQTMVSMCLCDDSIEAGIMTTTPTIGTSYIVCEVPSSITVSTMLQPPPSSDPASSTS